MYLRVISFNCSRHILTTIVPWILENNTRFSFWCLTSLSTIWPVKSWRSVLLVEETGIPGENHRPVASHWQTLSHSVVSSTPRLSSDWYWVQLKQDSNTGLPKPCTRGGLTLHYLETVKQIYLINNGRVETLTTTGQMIPFVWVDKQISWFLTFYIYKISWKCNPNSVIIRLMSWHLLFSCP